jgi:hypothetical protein
MKFGSELIPTSSGQHIYSDMMYYSKIDHKLTLFLIITHLHLQNKINDAKMKSMFKSLKAGTLIRKINTYHCKINNRWYNDESMFNVLCHVYEDICIRKDLDIEVVLKYLNKFLNANRNYCINYIYLEFILPLFGNLEDTNNVKLLKTFELKSFNVNYVSYEEADMRGDLSFGYCCSDCSGCLGEYKRNQYQYRYNKPSNIKQMKQYFINELNSLKTKNYKKSPYQLSSETESNCFWDRY